jgi:hypothetical protein
VTPRTPARQLEGFLARYSPEVARLGRTAIARMRRRLPGATALVYDNYNALAVAFGPSDKTSEAILSIAVYPRWVSLFFTRGTALPDPEKLLRGRGNVMRHLVLANARTLDRPAVVALIANAVAHAPHLLDPGQPSRLVIKSVSPHRRPRRAPARRTAPPAGR